MTVVDLGACTGSWCQVAVQKLKKQAGTGDRLASSGTLLGRDLEGDFTEASALIWLEEKLKSDGLTCIKRYGTQISGVM